MTVGFIILLPSLLSKNKSVNRRNKLKIIKNDFEENVEEFVSKQGKEYITLLRVCPCQEMFIVIATAILPILTGARDTILLQTFYFLLSISCKLYKML